MPYMGLAEGHVLATRLSRFVHLDSDGTSGRLTQRWPAQIRTPASHFGKYFDA
jgi:hypothetical protein